MEDIIPFLFVLAFVLVLVTLVGHGIWVVLAAFLRAITGSKSESSSQTLSLNTPTANACPNCGFALRIQVKFCGVCGAHRMTLSQEQELRELDVTLRQLEKLYWHRDESESDLDSVKLRIAAARELILFPNGRPERTPAPPTATEPTTA